MAVHLSDGSNIIVGRRPGIWLSGSATPWYRAGGAPLPVAAYQPKGAASLAASYVNLANPGVNNAAPGVAPTFAAATGWTFNGTTQYLDTGVVPDLTASAWSMLVRFAGGTGTTTRMVAGLYGGSAGLEFGLYPSSTAGTINGYANGNVRLVENPALAAGVMAIAGLKAYLNGAEVGTISSVAGLATVLSIYLGARNSSGSASSFWNGNIQAVAIYSSTLTAAQVAAVSAAMSQL